MGRKEREEDVWSEMDGEEETAGFVKEKWGINITWEVSLLGKSEGFPSPPPTSHIMQADP